MIKIVNLSKWFARIFFIFTTTVQAGGSKPIFTIVPIVRAPTQITPNGTAFATYRVTNTSIFNRNLVMQPISGIIQLTGNAGDCPYPFPLAVGQSCLLRLQLFGSEIPRPLFYGPVICKTRSASDLRPDLFLCAKPTDPDALHITVNPLALALISATGSPLTLTVDGLSGQLKITNTTLEVAATNIASNFIGTALYGNVTETGNTCTYVPPGGSCTITYTPGNTVVPQTNFTIQGTNTNALTAAIAIQSGSTLTAINPASGTASGGTGFTLTGTGLTGSTSVTFDGILATSVNVVDSTTVTGVTPAHSVGVVDVVIDSPAGGATLANGYTYETTTVGQSALGGTIACLNGGLNNLIAATADNSTAIEWGGYFTAVGVGAQSNTDGASNTTAIVAALGNNGGTPYAAQLCNDFEVDSQGNTPCQAGNTCYNDWFLPAGNNFAAAGQLNCLFTNRGVIGGFSSFAYWSSTEFSGDPTLFAWVQIFSDGVQEEVPKDTGLWVRCVRAFTP